MSFSHWTQSPGDIRNSSVDNLAMDGSHAISMASDNLSISIVYSSDYGKNWDKSSYVLDSNIYSLSMSGSTAIAGLQNSILYSNDYGVTWKKTSAGDLNNKIWRAVFIKGSNALAGGGDDFSGINQGVWYSNDGGLNWYKSQGKIIDEYVVNLVMDGPNAVAGTYNGAWYSNDYGNTWNQGKSLGNIQMGVITSIFINGQNALAGTSDAGIWHSDDYGKTWTQVKNELSKSNTQVFMSGSNAIAVGSNADSQDRGMWYSDDYGKNWTRCTGDVSNENFYRLFMDGENAIASATFPERTTNRFNGIWYSSDSGINWAKSSSYPNNNFVISLFINGSHALVGSSDALGPVVEGGGVWYSTTSTMLEFVTVDGVIYAYIENDENSAFVYGYNPDTIQEDIVMVSAININDIVYNILYIQDNAFSDCKKLIKVSLPEYITRIGSNAFSNCENLKYSFETDNDNITAFRIPESVYVIDDSAFNGCKSLKFVLFENNTILPKFINTPFANCSEKIGADYYYTIVPNIDAVNSLKDAGFKNVYGLYTCPCGNIYAYTVGVSLCYVLGYNKTMIEKDIRILSFFTLPSEDTYVTFYINTRAFADSQVVESLVFGQNNSQVAIIDEEAFSGCSSLKTVQIPSSMSMIKSGAFNLAEKLESMYFENKENLPEFINSPTQPFNPNVNTTAYYQEGVEAYDGGNAVISLKEAGFANTQAIVPPKPHPIPSNICFPKNTPVKTDQGEIAIDKINSNVNTIRGKKIVAITQTISIEKHLVCFEKDSIAKNVPSQQTFVSLDHRVYYKGSMRKAEWFVRNFYNVTLVAYNGETLFNVLLENHETMIINNLICETLHPKNNVAKIYKKLQSLPEYNKMNFIVKINNYFNNNNINKTKNKK